MRDTLIIALEASWELDPVLMENNLWKRIEEEPERKAYAVKSDEKKKHNRRRKKRRIFDYIRLFLSVCELHISCKEVLRLA